MTLPGAAPMPLTNANAGCGFEGRALGAPLRSRHLDLGAGTQSSDTALRPGAWLFAALVAGGRLVVAGPGEQMEIHATQPLWARVYLPEASAVRAAECGCAPGLQARMQGVVAGVWLWERPLRQPCGPPPQPARAPSAAPSEVRVVDPRLEGAERGFRARLNAQAWRAELARPEGAAMARGDMAAVVTRHVLASYPSRAGG